MPIIKGLPYFTAGEVVTGFGRGSKDLGIPTANFPASVVKSLPNEIDTGVYFGFANIDNGPVYKMVMSVGWNPYYQNKQKSMETHIMHKFEDDFYGKQLKIVMLGFIRSQRDFNSVDELIKAINYDISLADKHLEADEYKSYLQHSFFKQ